LAKEPVNPGSLEKPSGYAHAFEVRGGRLLFLAGQEGKDRLGHVVGKGDVVAQFRQICENFKAVLEARGASFHDIVKLTIYVVDKDDYRAKAKPIGAVYREYFGRHYPAMTLAEVRSLWDSADGAVIEIEAIAALD
jgi:enamine deaminase RidA (YjgF/YER057c/UK114 family)